MNPIFRNIYITTSIPYVNAAPHVGHAQEFVLADALARLYRYAGHSVTFQTGTDENAFKNVASAKLSGVEPLEFVAANASKFRDLADQLSISYTQFIRTTEERHARGVHLFWRSLSPKDLYINSYRGLYCQGCEDFYQEKDLLNGLCPDHRSQPQFIEENNTFFALSKYQESLEQLISSDTIRIVPHFRKNEVLSFIRQGLQDISITRDANRSVGWGVRVPDNANQVVYVWIDALVNYLSGQGFGTSENWRKIWNEQTRKIHVIGKNVWKFHAIYWPALLLSAGLPLPDEIVIHGFLTVDGEKISKSLGNAVDPRIVTETLGPDPLRHFLLAHLSLYQDADFAVERLRGVYNADFANTLGNLLSRVAAIARQGSFSPSVVPAPTSSTALAEVLRDYEVQAFALKQWDRLRSINAEINQTKPWELLKRGDRASVEELLRKWTGEIYEVTSLLSNLIPASGAQILDVLEKGIQTLEGPLFPRLDTNPP